MARLKSEIEPDSARIRAANPIPVIPASTTKPKAAKKTNRRADAARKIYIKLSKEIHEMNQTIAEYNRQRQAKNYETAKKLLEAIEDRKLNIQALRQEQKYY